MEMGLHGQKRICDVTLERAYVIKHSFLSFQKNTIVTNDGLVATRVVGSVHDTQCLVEFIQD